MQQLFDTQDDIILELDAGEDRKQIHYLTEVLVCEPQPPRSLSASDIDFSTNLLLLGADPAGQQKPESPSSLETLMVSPLARREVLQQLGAGIPGTEQWLVGTLGGIPLHRQADVLLSLPENRLLVVDYKRSSASSRRPRMQKGYDSQASLYRTMLQTGGLKTVMKTTRS